MSIFDVLVNDNRFKTSDHFELEKASLLATSASYKWMRLYPAAVTHANELLLSRTAVLYRAAACSTGIINSYAQFLCG